LHPAPDDADADALLAVAQTDGVVRAHHPVTGARKAQPDPGARIDVRHGTVVEAARGFRRIRECRQTEPDQSR
jgi:hypothetical protein